MSEQERRILLLSSEIGRGHPFYLDGLHGALVAALAGSTNRPLVQRAGVFDVSRGFARAAWSGVRAAYRAAGQGGLVAHAYHRLRGAQRYDADSFALRLLARDVRTWAGREGALVVDHPVLAGAMRERADTWTIHGEMVAPAEAVVKCASRVFVPLEETADAFTAHGLERARLRVTGICIEASLVPAADAQADLRCHRISAKGPLTAAFFSSGAEPPAHVRTLAAAATAWVRTGRPAIVFAAHGGRLARAVAAAASNSMLELVRFASRAEIDRETSARFSRFDLVVSPPHERSNWAVALGVPFFLVGPDIGPFAPMNRALLLREKVAVPLDADRAAAFPAFVDKLRTSGALLEMSRAGKRRPIDGFRRAAEILLNEMRRG